MSSSTSRSNRLRFVSLVASLVVSSGIAIVYTLNFNPEIRFWKAALAHKRQWSDQVHQSFPRVNVFSGGSTTAFQVDDVMLTRSFGIPSVNAGLNAGLGLDGTIVHATAMLRPGDRLILMTEPEMLAEGGGEKTALASQLSLAASDSDGFEQTAAQQPLIKTIAACRPGLYHAATMVGKLASRRPLYRYGWNDMHEGGFITTSVRNDLSGEGLVSSHPELTPRAIHFLRQLKAWAERRGVEVAYLMPVSYVHPSQIERQRQANSKYLDQIESIIPVLRDSYLGASPNLADFADTALHMTEAAGKERTMKLGQLLSPQ